MATAVKASVCEVLWTQVGLETIRAHAYDVLNKRDSVVQTALDDILVANPNRESTLYWYDVYDGIHRVLWGEILRQKLELPLTPSQQKALVKQAQQRVVEVYSTP